MQKKNVFLLFLFLIFKISFSQDTIEFINGNVILTKITAIDNENVYTENYEQKNVYEKKIIFSIKSINKDYYTTNYNKITLNNGSVYYSDTIDIRVVNDIIIIKFQELNKDKNRIIKKDKIFSLITKDGDEQIIYQQDTLFNNDYFSAEEMRRAILGKKYAKETFKCNFVGLGGLTSGLAGGYFGFGGLLVPALYTTIIGVKDAKIKEPKENTNYLYNKYYFDDSFRSGYQIVANNKRFKRAIVGGVIGFAISVTIFSLTYQK
ncbi:MAG: hypothetical protein A2X02_01010 [Bacteroidetes bacterium GWF2_29_10]|nr:MAG: hypothetical protein A2X02_01010 [Bacteroidetes bacterium GWF2_29_10]